VSTHQGSQDRPHIVGAIADVAFDEAPEIRCGRVVGEIAESGYAPWQQVIRAQADPVPLQRRQA
jgi:hypothetical protein